MVKLSDLLFLCRSHSCSSSWASMNRLWVNRRKCVSCVLIVCAYTLGRHGQASHLSMLFFVNHTDIMFPGTFCDSPKVCYRNSSQCLDNDLTQNCERRNDRFCYYSITTSNPNELTKRDLVACSLEHGESTCSFQPGKWSV